MKYEPQDYEVRIFFSKEDGCFIAVASVTPWSISAGGDTQEEALQEVREALALALQTAEEQGMDIPAPTLSHV
jgi:predicted RNase H-like HicB family nuclease